MAYPKVHFTADDAKGVVSQPSFPRLELDVPINIHLTGCPNSCAQHYIGDIGLLGTKVSVDDDMVEGYHIFLGGGYGPDQDIGREIRVVEHPTTDSEPVCSPPCAPSAPVQLARPWSEQTRPRPDEFVRMIPDIRRQALQGAGW